jgi:hypothetical protein
MAGGAGSAGSPGSSGTPNVQTDEVLCPILRTLSPGVPGVVDIDPTGDTYIGGSFIWDCPPYEV